MSEIKPLQIPMAEFAVMASCSDSKLWDLTNVKSKHFDPSAPRRIKFGRSTRFNREHCETWIRAMEKGQVDLD